MSRGVAARSPVTRPDAHAWPVAGQYYGGRMPWNGHRSVKRYSLAVGIVALSATASVLLSTAMAVQAPLIVFFPGVILALFLGGLGPDILTTALSAIIGLVLMIWPDHRLEEDEILRLTIFTLASALSCRMMAAGEKHAQTEIDLLGTAMASAAEGIARLADDGALVSFNASLATTVGQPDDVLAKRSILDLVHPADRLLLADAMRQSRQTGHADAEVRMLCQDSTPVDVNLTLVRLSTMDGSSRGHYCFMRDISLRKREETQLKERLDRFLGAFRHSHVGLAIVSPDGRLLEVNPAACVITGFTEGELMARNFQSITHPDDLPTDLDLLRRLRSGEIDHYHLHKRYVGRRGEAIPVQVIVTMARDNRARPQYYIVQVQAMGDADSQPTVPPAAPPPPATGI
jgi:PAS domain S-box-containing protein